MASPRGHWRGHVIRADVAFGPGADIRAPGGAVTIALCGSWDHDGSCRWPHHTAVDTSSPHAIIRVVYVVDDGELGHVRDLIESAVTSGTDWRTIAIGHDTLTEEERILSQRLRGEQ